MSLLPLRFRSIASRLGISDFTASDLKLERVIPIIKTNFNEKLELAIVKGEIDINEPNDIWELLYIDSIIRLEDRKGQSIRVGVALQSREDRAYRIYAQVQKPTFQKILKDLGIERFWIFAISDSKRYFLTHEEWIDLLYEQIDLPANTYGCKLINLG